MSDHQQNLQSQEREEKQKDVAERDAAVAGSTSDNSNILGIDDIDGILGTVTTGHRINSSDCAPAVRYDPGAHG